tara:strand:- start:436 stop:621 length:186 start_codon:yes stop_codon:yes gene_type:complete
MKCFEQVKDYNEIIEGFDKILDLKRYFKEKERTNDISKSDYNYIDKRLYEILTKLKGQSKR